MKIPELPPSEHQAKKYDGPSADEVLRLRNRQSKEPAKEECAQVLELAKGMGLLLRKGGLWGQTVRFSPPMCLHEQDPNFLLEVLDRAFERL